MIQDYKPSSRRLSFLPPRFFRHRFPFFSPSDPSLLYRCQVLLSISCVSFDLLPGAGSRSLQLCCVVDEGTKGRRLGIDLVSEADCQAAETVKRGTSPWKPLRCETVRCLGETGFSLSANGAVFPQVLPSACQVMIRSMFLQWFLLFEDN
ncbi:hypothetical protein TNCV_1172151 [Trichonephila clavipes]|uniref:Uncharacterized protein n=1 Tax=Trichonephila clavipes TaxID=2585209 RepID=A0A8X6S2A0_TRICX|nr:hypothetical protein TNCV_1172151 [Trichonephila clavipes]